MASQPHRIRRLRWQARASDRETAFVLRAALRAEIDDLVPLLETACDLAVPADRVVHLPRLELSLRARNLESLHDDLHRQLPALIAEALQAALPQCGLSTAETDADRPGEPGSPGISLAAYRRDALIQYLETGLPPWSLPTDREHFRSTLQAAALKLIDDDAALRRLFDATAEACALRAHRLLRLLPEAQRRRLAGSLAGAKNAAATTSTAGEIDAHAATEILRWLERIAEHHPVLALRAQVLRLALHRASPVATLAPLLSVLLRELLTMARDEPAPTLPTAWRLAPVPRPAADSQVEMEQRPSQASPPRVFSPQDEPAEAEDGHALAATHAGLILLHPFLPALFEEVGMLDAETGALSEAQTARAAALLAWLATGEDNPIEAELGFIKIMLGMTHEAPLICWQDGLDETDRAEGEALLTAVIGHWSALGRTSIDGLRVSFLQRRGRLEPLEHGWRLRLEPESFDLLLGSLPWSIGIVKLPWMALPVYAEWNA